MAVATKRPLARHSAYERILRSKYTQLLNHLRDHREMMVAEQVPEDEGDLATRTLLEGLAVGTLQREQQLLGEVEAALRRLREGIYGVCEGCGVEILQRRLQALPWTRFCLACAERRQAHWKN